MTDQQQPSPPQYQAPPPASQEESDRQFVLITYILQAASVIVGITSLIATVMCFVKRDQVAPWLKTHLDFQIRTFLIGLAGFIIGAILTVILIGLLVLLAVAVWYIIRIVMAFILFNDRKPISNVDTFLLPA
jgi:uncharacterized membrane protein